MKLRLAWLADAEYADSYSAKETRVLLGALARDSNFLPMWIATGSNEPPHIWNNIRIYPFPVEVGDTYAFLTTLIAQLRPHAILSNLDGSLFCTMRDFPTFRNIKWFHRLPPNSPISDNYPRLSSVLFGREHLAARFPHGTFVPYLRGFDSSTQDGMDATTVLDQLKRLLLNGTHGAGAPSGDTSTTVIQNSGAPVSRGTSSYPTHLVMRQQLFCNTSWAQVMFELTNALIELGVPTVAQDEQSAFAKGYIHREEDLYRTGAAEKYNRVFRSVDKEFDPDNAVTLHFTLFKSDLRHTRAAVFQSLGREALYITGNHTVTALDIRRLSNIFVKLVAPSRHVLRPYLEAGLDRHMGSLVPHGVDPDIYAPECKPFSYPTEKRFKFMQTSFPWVFEKGFDLTVKAFSRAFTRDDDVSLILRVPKIRNLHERETTFGSLERLVCEARSQAKAPEILILEADVELSRRGGFYTGADCYVHPLRAEGFGMTILEAMACGLPVIATPWSGPADFLSPLHAYTLHHSNPIAERANNGAVLRYHVEPDMDHLIHLMRYVYEHRDEAKALGRRASASVRREWTWKHAAKKLADSIFPNYAAFRYIMA